ncbi:MAG: serine protease [Burkholderiales bacterium]
MNPSRTAISVVAAVAAALFLAFPSRGAETGPSPGRRPATQAEGEFAPAKAEAAPQRRWPAGRATAEIVLERVAAKRLEAEALQSPAKPGTPFRIGFGREVPALREASVAASLLEWIPAGDERVAALRVVSPEALGVRLGLRVESIAPEARLRFYASATDEVFEATGREILAAIDRNLASGDTGEEAITWWSPVVEGEGITLEIGLPDGVSPEAVRVSAPRLSHLFASPREPRLLQAKIGQSGACNLDVVCHLATWGTESLATARMVFTDSGSSYLCTGTLLNDTVPATAVPYFLSAHHCISTQTVASTLQTYWFYRASSCMSGALAPGSQTLAGGATLLHAGPATDTSFLRLNNAPPAGALYAGWSSALASLGTAAAGVHHPSGDLQKISFGTIAGYLDCANTPGGSTYSCSSAPPGSANHLNVTWSQGVTEGGSSGSGLWITSSGSRYLVGQLHGGSSFCAMPTAPDQYGRFDVAYGAALHQWLDPPAVPAAATLVSPSGTISGTPAYTWNAVAGATQYLVYVSSGAATWHTAAAAGCASGTGTCSVPGTALAPGSYAWYVLTWNAAGFGPWSAAMNFTVSTGGPPAAATLVSPSGTIGGTPTYTWNAVAGAAYYFVYLSNGALTLHSAAEAGCPAGTGQCSVAGRPLVSGNYTWFVLTWNPDGAGPWSAGMNFIVSSSALPAAAVPVGPTGSIGGAPAYTWEAVSNASHYLLYVNGVLTVHTAVEAGCGSGIGNCSITGAALPAGAYTWFVLTWNPNGAGPWSAGTNFTSTGP